MTRSISIPLQDRFFAALACNHSPMGIRDYAIHATLGYAGLRAAEVGRLKLEHLDLETGQLYVIEGKGGKDRPGFILPPLDGILERYLTEARPVLLRGRESPYVFISRNHGRPLGSRGVYRLVRCTMERVLGIKGHPHMLRHGLGFRLHENGASPIDVRDMLGHENIRTTERYIRVTSSQRGRLSKAMSPSPATEQPTPQAPRPRPAAPADPARPVLRVPPGRRAVMERRAVKAKRPPTGD